MAARIDSLQTEVLIGAVVRPWFRPQRDAKIGPYANQFRVGGQLIPKPAGEIACSPIPGCAIRDHEVMPEPPEPHCHQTERKSWNNPVSKR